MTQHYIKECEGCTMLSMGIECKVLELYEAENCPCLDCIVKPMCEDPCEDFNDLTRDIDEDEDQ